MVRDLRTGLAKGEKLPLTPNSNFFKKKGETMLDWHFKGKRQMTLFTLFECAKCFIVSSLISTDNQINIYRHKIKTQHIYKLKF